MTQAEFAQIAVVLDHCWPGEFTETMEAAYFCVLQDKPADLIEQACRNLVNKGARFRPTPPELVKAAGMASDRSQFLESQREAFALLRGDRLATEFFPQLGQVALDA